jgi:hypothetical protein
MSVITRKFSASPVRTAAHTWDTIVSVITSSDSVANTCLQSISGIAASIISDGSPKSNPITIIGSGPRLRVYCLYDEEGSTEDANESSLTWKPFEGEWEIYFPVEKDDLEWVTQSLKNKDKRFKTYESGTKIAESESANRAANNTAGLTIDIEKLNTNG